MKIHARIGHDLCTNFNLIVYSTKLLTSSEPTRRCPPRESNGHRPRKWSTSTETPRTISVSMKKTGRTGKNGMAQDRYRAGGTEVIKLLKHSAVEDNGTTPRLAC